ncbi:Imm42 family immunity protein [Methylovulum psychrotolerans]|uniref:Uncharacterized protein n=1 Tax=Methylovulum psychrotolerans TaxID=1704499 RepID=A0A1Z4C4P7_9GAMM|nr:Imm42 family immunity protein [Methylovulum psychrotolerans]ASF48512.1 hypothetical protein CEK71_21985 [Methylovulum psychrotolerans]
MIIGNKSTFAIESSITRAYGRLSFRALGYFVIHIGGTSYGINSPDATLLACSFDEIKNRFIDRGTHKASFAIEPSAKKIANAINMSIYSESQIDENFFGMSLSEFYDIVTTNHIIWAPDGDEAFDDGSHVLHFDIENHVRLIGFKRGNSDIDDKEYHSLIDLWLDADEFYSILIRWYDVFESEWEAAVKWDNIE